MIRYKQRHLSGARPVLPKPLPSLVAVKFSHPNCATSPTRDLYRPSKRWDGNNDDTHPSSWVYGPTSFIMSSTSSSSYFFHSHLAHLHGFKSLQRSFSKFVWGSKFRNSIMYHNHHLDFIIQTRLYDIFTFLFDRYLIRLLQLTKLKISLNFKK